MTMAKRELITVHGDKRYIQRDERGRFTSSQETAGRANGTEKRQSSRGRPQTVGSRR